MVKSWQLIILYSQIVKTSVIWTVGCLSHFRFGDSYEQTIKAGAFAWKLTFYPKGLTDPGYARFFTETRPFVFAKLLQIYMIYEMKYSCSSLRGLDLPTAAFTSPTSTASESKEAR